MYCIYRITNLINGKTYIGQHKYKKTPYDRYMGSGKLLRKAYKKYGIENFIKDVIIAGINDKETINKLEIKYIAYERTSNGNGCYNITNGGEGFSGPMSEEHRANLSTAHKGKKRKPFSEEHRAKISASMKAKQNTKGKCLSEEHRAKISASMTGRKRGPYKRKLNYN